MDSARPSSGLRIRSGARYLRSKREYPHERRIADRIEHGIFDIQVHAISAAGFQPYRLRIALLRGKTVPSQGFLQLFGRQPSIRTKGGLTDPHSGLPDLDWDDRTCIALSPKSENTGSRG